MIYPYKKSELLELHHLKQGDGVTVFGNSINIAVRHIRAIYATLPYDPVPFLASNEKFRHPFMLLPEFRVSYACFKWAVAHVVQPKTIVEIGIGSGIAAHAFLNAAPDAHYTGVDNNFDTKLDCFPYSDFVIDSLRTLGYDASFRYGDSTRMRAIPYADLAHLDGHHTVHGAYCEASLALEAGARWILVDDSKDALVAKGTMDAIHDFGDRVEWESFNETWGGNILIHNVNAA